jgi:hypothetical protein
MNKLRSRVSELTNTASSCSVHRLVPSLVFVLDPVMRSFQNEQAPGRLLDQRLCAKHSQLLYMQHSTRVYAVGIARYAA